MRSQIILAVLALTCYGKTIRVAVNDFPPCVILESSKPTGFDIDLWETIAGRLNLDYEYVRVDHFPSLFDSLVTGTADIGLAGITINEKRERIIDFSHPYLKSGLNIVVKKKGSTGFFRVVYLFFTSSWDTIAIFLGFIVLCGIVIWRVEKGRTSFDDRPLHGIADGMYWTNVTMTTVGYGDKTPHTPLGKFVAIVVMWIGIYLISPYVIAKMSLVMTMQEIYQAINSKDDLSGRRVTTVDGTTSVDALKNLNANVITRTSFDECYDLLIKDGVDAMVYDMPALRYAVLNDSGRIAMTGPVFDEQDYGIALQQNSSLREPLNLALLEIMSDGTYEKLYSKWFGRK